MTRRTFSLAIACAALVACAPKPAPLTYDPARVTGVALDAPLVVTPPFDDRYAAERDGETFTTRFAVGFIGFAYRSNRGNQITGDANFTNRGGPFGTKGVVAGVGNLIAAAFARDTGAIADTAPLEWRCRGGTCAPSPAAVIAAATRHGARYVLATRVVHLYGVRFGERQFSVASYKERRGLDTYQVTQTTDARSYSTGFGNCTLEVSLFLVDNGRILRTARGSFTANKSESFGSSPDARTGLARLAVRALGDTLDRMRAGSKPAPPPPAPPPPQVPPDNENRRAAVPATHVRHPGVRVSRLATSFGCSSAPPSSRSRSARSSPRTMAPSRT